MFILSCSANKGFVMKKLLILLALSFNVQANCIVDATGAVYCQQQAPIADYRTDHNSPQIYQNGQYRGNLNGNRYDPNSISNPYGRYGNPYSLDSINNPYGAGNPYGSPY